MSVNRFEMQPLLCAAPEALMAVPTDTPVDIIIDIRKDWQSAGDRVTGLIDHRKAARSPGMILLRICMPDDDKDADALEKLVALRTDGLVLSGCGSAADIQKLGVMLRVAEAELEIEDGATTVFAEVGEKTGFFLSAHSLCNISNRLQGLILDGEAVAMATSSQIDNIPAGRPGAAVMLARATTVLKARHANIDCYDMIANAPISAGELRNACDVALADGFSGVIVRTEEQLAALTSR